MRLKGSIKPVFIVIAIVVTIVMLFGALTFDRMSNVFRTSDVARVTLRNFTPGTQVDYRIITNEKIFDQQHAKADNNGNVSLSLSKETLARVPKNTDIKYELEVAKPEALLEKEEIASNRSGETEINSAQILNLLLSLNPEEGSMGVSVKGLGEYSNILLKENNEKSQSLNADWAGMFATTLGGPNALTNDDYAQLQLAFQSAGIQSDMLTNQAGMPLIEVQALTGALLGTGSRDKQTAHWSGPIAEITSQLSAVMSQQTHMIGMFIDASIQLETQRKIQELHARAHKDYHPSEQMCRVGTFVRSIFNAESKAEVEKEALNKYLINQYTGVVHSATSGGPDVYEKAKIKDFRDNFCHAVDNGSSVSAICDEVTNATSFEELDRMNKDIDYTRAVEARLTLDIDFADGNLEQDEADVLALARYLYFSSAFNAPQRGTLDDDVRPHYSSRSYAAKMGVAHSSFINIVGMKSRAPVGRATTANTTNPTPAPFGTGINREHGGLQTALRTSRPAVTSYTEDAGWAYMKAMLRDDFGISDVPVDTDGDGSAADNISDVDRMLGQRPSYYAQMEVLTKKIYQDPNFYVNLYDKPANVKRIGAAMDAILLMNQRDRYESLLRREMLAATLIENGLAPKVDEINASMFEQMQRSQIND